MNAQQLHNLDTIMNDNTNATLGCMTIVLFLAYGLVQIWAGYLGIDHHLGAGWAIAAVAVAIFLRFTLPVTIGSFFGAMDVWGWPWYWALLFAALGLAFLALAVPGLLASVLHRDFKNQ